MYIYVVNEINQFFFLANCWWLNGCNCVIVSLFLKIIIVKLECKFSYFRGFRLRFNLNVFYLNLFARFIIGITLEHTCCEAEEVENGH